MLGFHPESRNERMRRHSVRYTLAGIGAILLWGLSIPCVRRLIESLGVFTTGAAVFAVAGVLGLSAEALGGGFRAGAPRPSLRFAGVCGGLFVLNVVAVYCAVALSADRLQVVEIALVNYLWPTLTVVLSLPILGRRASWMLSPGVLMAMAGVFLVVTHANGFTWVRLAAHLADRPAPYAWAAAAAVSWALYSNLTGRWARESGAAPGPLFLLATGAVLGLLRLCHPEPSLRTPAVLRLLVFFSVTTALAYPFWDVAMRKGNADFVVACSYATPVLSTLFSCLLLHVAPGWRLWAGCGLIVLGAVLSRFSLKDSAPTR
jgi:drug/metabolite transporter (DMT)-like permease